MSLLLLLAVGCAPPADPPALSPIRDRTAAAQTTLDAILAATRSADRAAFDRQVLVRDPAFATRSDVWFANLSSLGRDDLRLRAASGAAELDPSRTGVLGSDAWVQKVVVSWRPRTAREAAEQAIWWTFAVEGDRALLAGDVDAPAAEQLMSRPIWLGGPIQVARRGRVVVVAVRGPGAQPWPARGQAAIAAVRSRLRGAWSGPLIIEVPATRQAFERSLGVADGSYAYIGAVAWPRGDNRQTAAVHVVVNPQVVAGLSAEGIAVLLAHEATHVATRSVHSAAPTWLIEGFADYVAYAAYPATEEAALVPLRRRIRGGWLPEALPSEADFRASAGELDLAYAQSWSLCRLLAERYGAARLERFYRVVGAGTDVGAALDTEFGLSTERLVQVWRHELRRLTPS